MNTHQVRHANLTSQQDVFASLRHWTVDSRDQQNRSVHLSRAGDHVLDVVGVTGAVDMRIHATIGFVLDVRSQDGHGLALIAFDSTFGDLLVGFYFGQALVA